MIRFGGVAEGLVGQALGQGVIDDELVAAAFELRGGQQADRQVDEPLRAPLEPRELHRVFEQVGVEADDAGVDRSRHALAAGGDLVAEARPGHLEVAVRAVGAADVPVVLHLHEARAHGQARVHRADLLVERLEQGFLLGERHGVQGRGHLVHEQRIEAEDLAVGLEGAGLGLAREPGGGGGRLGARGQIVGGGEAAVAALGEGLHAEALQAVHAQVLGAAVDDEHARVPLLLGAGDRVDTFGLRGFQGLSEGLFRQAPVGGVWHGHLGLLLSRPPLYGTMRRLRGKGGWTSMGWSV
ncbi:hypothetical protein D3C72_879720 [compost metagenome]